MNNQKLMEINQLITKAYDCNSFQDFLTLTILDLHNHLLYDSGMFFCGISKDSSFFKPYIKGSIENYYQKRAFEGREEYLEKGEMKASQVYKASDFTQGNMPMVQEPRSEFLSAQEDYHILCIRIEYKGQFMGEIYLHRSLDKPDFDGEDMLVASLLQPHISSVFHMIHTRLAIHFIENKSSAVAKKGIGLMDKEYKLLSCNLTGSEMLQNTTKFGSSVFYHLKEQVMDLQNEVKAKGKTVESPVLQLSIGDGQLLIYVLGQSIHSSKEFERFFFSMEFQDENQSVAEYKLKFTRREADIIDGIIQGKTNSQIANTLSISENTAKTHIQNIFQKIGVKSRTELIYILMLNTA